MLISLVHFFLLLFFFIFIFFFLSAFRRVKNKDLASFIQDFVRPEQGCIFTIVIVVL